MRFVYADSWTPASLPSHVCVHAISIVVFLNELTPNIFFLCSHTEQAPRKNTKSSKRSPHRFPISHLGDRTATCIHNPSNTLSLFVMGMSVASKRTRFHVVSDRSPKIKLCGILVGFLSPFGHFWSPFCPPFLGRVAGLGFFLIME